MQLITLTAINIFTMFPEPSDSLNLASMVIIGYPVLQGLVADSIPHVTDHAPPRIAKYIAGSFMLAALNVRISKGQFIVDADANGTQTERRRNADGTQTERRRNAGVAIAS